MVLIKSGHHENIRKWRLKESLRKTMIKRPDLLKTFIYRRRVRNLKRIKKVVIYKKDGAIIGESQDTEVPLVIYTNELPRLNLCRKCYNEHAVSKYKNY